MRLSTSFHNGPLELEPQLGVLRATRKTHSVPWSRLESPQQRNLRHVLFFGIKRPQEFAQLWFDLGRSVWVQKSPATQPSVRWITRFHPPIIGSLLLGQTGAGELELMAKQVVPERKTLSNASQLFQGRKHYQTLLNFCKQPRQPSLVAAGASVARAVLCQALVRSSTHYSSPLLWLNGCGSRNTYCAEDPWRWVFCLRRPFFNFFIPSLCPQSTGPAFWPFLLWSCIIRSHLGRKVLMTQTSDESSLSEKILKFITNQKKALASNTNFTNDWTSYKITR